MVGKQQVFAEGELLLQWLFSLSLAELDSMVSSFQMSSDADASDAADQALNTSVETFMG